MKQRLLNLLLAVVAIAAAVYGAGYWQRNYMQSVTLVQLPVPTNDIPPYTLLTASMFELLEFPRALVEQGSGYVLATADLEGKISAGMLLTAQPVPARMAVSPEQFRLADPTLEVVSIPAEHVNGVGGQLRIGEWVNIYRLRVTVEASTVGEDFTGLMDGAALPTPEPTVEFVAHVPIVAVLDETSQPANQGAEPRPMKIIIVAAPPETVQLILDAVAYSTLGREKLWITLATVP